MRRYFYNAPLMAVENTDALKFMLPLTLILNFPKFGGGDLASTNQAAANRPYHAEWISSKLFVVDLRDTIPTANGEAATTVFGQPNMTSSSANAGGLSSTSLSGPSDIR